MCLSSWDGNKDDLTDYRFASGEYNGNIMCWRLWKDNMNEIHLMLINEFPLGYGLETSTALANPRIQVQSLLFRKIYTKY